MKRSIQEAGFTAWELVVVVVVLVGIVAVGIHIYDSRMPVVTKTFTSSVTGSGVAQSSSKSAAASTTIPTAPQVTSTSDLDSAIQTLNQVNPSSSNASDTSQLNSQTNF